MVSTIADGHTSLQPRLYQRVQVLYLEALVLASFYFEFDDFADRQCAQYTVALCYFCWLSTFVVVLPVYIWTPFSKHKVTGLVVTDSVYLGSLFAIFVWVLISWSQQPTKKLVAVLRDLSLVCFGRAYILFISWTQKRALDLVPLTGTDGLSKHVIKVEFA